MSRRLELPITAELAGTRVNTLLKKHLGLSGTVVRRVKWLEDGILVDGIRVNTRFCPRVGQVLSVRLSDPDRRSGIVPAPGPLDIVYEDEDILVLNKTPGVSIHPGPGHFDDTICNFLLYYYDLKGIEGDAHPVHRLDRGTSGLLVVAKHPHAQEKLKGHMHTGAFRRIYLAVCDGVPEPEQGRVEAPIGRVPASLIMRQVDPSGQPAATRYRVVERAGENGPLRMFLEINGMSYSFVAICRQELLGPEAVEWAAGFRGSAQRAGLVTTGTFTRRAVTAAGRLNVALVDRPNLPKIQRAARRAAQRRAFGIGPPKGGNGSENG